MRLGKGVGLGSGQTVLDGDEVGAQPPTAAPPHFRPMPIVAKRSPISVTAELLLFYTSRAIPTTYWGAVRSHSSLRCRDRSRLQQNIQHRLPQHNNLLKKVADLDIPNNVYTYNCRLVSYVFQWSSTLY